MLLKRIIFIVREEVYMFLYIIFIIIGFFLLMKGADFLVDGASGIAKKFKIPTIIIGLTIVAIRYFYARTYGKYYSSICWTF